MLLTQFSLKYTKMSNTGKNRKMEILEKIDALRKERGWSINNLAMEAALTQSTLNNLYTRHTEPKISTLKAICGAFGITLSEFFQEQDESAESDIDVTLNRAISKLSVQQKKALITLLGSSRRLCN